MHTLYHPRWYLCMLLCSCFVTVVAQHRYEINAGAGTASFFHTESRFGEVRKGANVRRSLNYTLYASFKWYDKRRKNAVGIVVGRDQSAYTYDPYAGFERRDVRRVYTIALEGATVYSAPGALLQVYGSFSMGRAFMETTSYYKGWEAVEHEQAISFHIAPFCFRYGKKAGGFAELGFGYKGLINAGAFMRF